MCEICTPRTQNGSRAGHDDPAPPGNDDTPHFASCLIWGLPNPRPEDCDCAEADEEKTP